MSILNRLYLVIYIITYNSLVSILTPWSISGKGPIYAGPLTLEVVFYYTTCGWMMWNWLASALAQQATIVLYEGSPGFPDFADKQIRRAGGKPGAASTVRTGIGVFSY